MSPAGRTIQTHSAPIQLESNKMPNIAAQVNWVHAPACLAVMARAIHEKNVVMATTRQTAAMCNLDTARTSSIATMISIHPARLLHWCALPAECRSVESARARRRTRPRGATASTAGNAYDFDVVCGVVGVSGLVGAGWDFRPLRPSSRYNVAASGARSAVSGSFARRFATAYVVSA